MYALGSPCTAFRRGGAGQDDRGGLGNSSSTGDRVCLPGADPGAGNPAVAGEPQAWARREIQSLAEAILSVLHLCSIVRSKWLFGKARSGVTSEEKILTTYLAAVQW